MAHQKPLIIQVNRWHIPLILQSKHEVRTSSPSAMNFLLIPLNFLPQATRSVDIFAYYFSCWLVRIGFNMYPRYICGYRHFKSSDSIKIHIKIRHMYLGYISKQIRTYRWNSSTYRWTSSPYRWTSSPKPPRWLGGGGSVEWGGSS